MRKCAPPVVELQYFLVFVVLLSSAPVAFSQGLATKQTPRKSLKQYVAELQKSPEDTQLREKIINLVLGMKPKPAVPEEARAYYVEGTTVLKMAKDKHGAELAVASLDKASSIAPWWGDAYYNLASAYELADQFDRAEAALALYLLTQPSAQDARQAQDRIYEIRAKKKLAKVAPVQAPAPEPKLTVEGDWYAPGTRFRIDVRRPASVLAYSALESGEKRFNNTWDIGMTETTVEFKRSSWQYGEPRHREDGHHYSCALIESGSKLNCATQSWGDHSISGTMVLVRR